MAFSLDRDAAARRLGISTRTVDRHIQSGKIRSRRIGKKLFLEEDDVESMRLEDPARREEDYIVILPDEIPEEDPIHETGIIQKNSAEITLALNEFSRIYDHAQSLISQKESTIQDLAFRLGKAQTELEKSIDINEYKKANYMMETLKTQHDTASRLLNNQVRELEKELQKRNSALVGLTLLFVVVLCTSLIFVFWDRLI